jgi:DNA-binding MarR family transcriptional regulator
MSTSLTELRSSLDALSAGDIDTREARLAVRRAIDSGGDMIDRVYVALRGAAWRIISARQVPEDLAEWHDIHTHAAVRARLAERPDLAERLSTLAELVAQTGRFADRQPLNEVLERRHVVDLLVELARHGGSARRALLAEATALADANLSRVLAILSAHGLIMRKRSGKEALFSLTEAGRGAAAKAGALCYAPTGISETTWWNQFDVPVALWTADGDQIGSSDAFRRLVSDAGCQGLSALDWRAWTGWLESTVRDEHPADQGKRVLQLSDRLWVRYVEQHFQDGTICVWLFDISVEKETEANLSRELRAYEQEIAKLKEQIAEAEAKAEEHRRRLLSFMTAVNQRRFDLMKGAASLATRIKSWAESVPETWRPGFEDVDRQAMAIKQAMQYLLAMPDASKPKLPNQILDPRVLIEQSGEIVSRLSGSHFEYDFHEIKQVRAYEPALRAAICHAMLTHLRESNAQKYILSTKVENKTLFVLLLGLDGLRARDADFDHFMQLEGDESTIMQSYSYCRDLVQLVNGKVSAGVEESGRRRRSFVQMTFPVETVKGKTPSYAQASLIAG